VSNEWLVWSNEHQAWWRPCRSGYTTLTHEAGWYSEREADEIVTNANRWLNEGAWPKEVKVRAPRSSWAFDQFVYASTFGSTLAPEWR
jgi:hypothetical protein